jgi:hypothetical protein
MREIGKWRMLAGAGLALALMTGAAMAVPQPEPGVQTGAGHQSNQPQPNPDIRRAIHYPPPVNQCLRNAALHRRCDRDYAYCTSHPAHRGVCANQFDRCCESPTHP